MLLLPIHVVNLCIYFFVFLPVLVLPFYSIKLSTRNTHPTHVIGPTHAVHSFHGSRRPFVCLSVDNSIYTYTWEAIFLLTVTYGDLTIRQSATYRTVSCVWSVIILHRYISRDTTRLADSLRPLLSGFRMHYARPTSRRVLSSGPANMTTQIDNPNHINDRVLDLGYNLHLKLFPLEHVSYQSYHSRRNDVKNEYEKTVYLQTTLYQRLMSDCSYHSIVRV